HYLLLMVPGNGLMCKARQAISRCIAIFMLIRGLHYAMKKKTNSINPPPARFIQPILNMLWVIYPPTGCTIGSLWIIKSAKFSRAFLPILLKQEIPMDLAYRGGRQ